MGETKRILKNRSWMILIFLLFTGNLCVFLYSNLVNKNGNFKEIREGYGAVIASYQNQDVDEALAGVTETLSHADWSNDRIWMMYEARESLEHLQEGKGFYHRLMQQYKDGKSLSVFNTAYSQKNLEKTVSDFTFYQDFTFRFIHDKTYQSILESGYTGIFMVFAVFFLVCIFFEERLTGLNRIVRCTKKGRGHLCATRIGILITASAAIVALFYGVKVLSAYGIYGGIGEGSLPVQTISLLQKITWQISIREFLWLFGFLQFLGVLTAALLMWVLLILIPNNNLAYLAGMCFLFLEYMAKTVIASNSRFVILKSINIYSILDWGDSFKEYLNLYLFGGIMEQKTVLFILCFSLITLLIFLILFLNHREGESRPIPFLKQVRNRMGIWKGSIVCRLSAWGFEVYKVLVLQHGGIILLFMLIVLMNSKLPAMHMSEEDRSNEIYYNAWQGKLTEKKRNVINYEKQEIENRIVSLTKQMEEEPDNYNIQTQLRYNYLWADSVEKIQNQIQEIKRENIVAADGSYYLVNPYSFYHYFDYQDKTRRTLLFMQVFVFLVLIMGDNFSFEKRSSPGIIHTARDGRGILCRRKITVSFGFSLFIILAYELWELILTGRGWKGELILNAPLKAISFLQDSDFTGSILYFIAVLVLLRIFVGMAATVLILIVSAYTKRRERAYMGSFLVILLMPLASFTSAAFLKELSLCYYGGVMEYWYENALTCESLAKMAVVLLLVIIIGVVLIHRKFCKNI